MSVPGYGAPDTETTGERATSSDVETIVTSITVGHPLRLLGDGPGLLLRTASLSAASLRTRTCYARQDDPHIHSDNSADFPRHQVALSVHEVGHTRFTNKVRIAAYSRIVDNLTIKR